MILEKVKQLKLENQTLAAENFAFALDITEEFTKNSKFSVEVKVNKVEVYIKTGWFRHKRLFSLVAYANGIILTDIWGSKLVTKDKLEEEIVKYLTKLVLLGIADV